MVSLVLFTVIYVGGFCAAVHRLFKKMFCFSKSDVQRGRNSCLALVRPCAASFSAPEQKVKKNNVNRLKKLKHRTYYVSKT